MPGGGDAIMNADCTPSLIDRGRPLRSLSMRMVFVLLAAAAFESWFGSQPMHGQAAPPEPLPHTTALEWPEEDLSGRLMDGAHRFVERQIADMQARAGRFWSYDRSSAAAWNASLHGNRDRLREIIGAVDARVAPALERVGDDDNPALVAEAPAYRVWQVRWPVLEGLTAEGLLVEPTTKRQAATDGTGAASPVASLVVVPDAGQTPEQILGLAPGLLPERQFARLLAESGCELVIPTLVQRTPIQTDDPQLRQSEQTWREWIYRQGFHMGRHVIGLEVQKVLAAVDRFRARRGAAAKVGVVGYAEGGVIAFHAAAIDTRIDGALVSGYFDRRGRVWQEPIDRNVWSRLERFGDAEIAALVMPRHLVIEHADVPSFTSSRGAWHTPSGTSVRSEFHRIPAVATFSRPSLVTGQDDRPVAAMSAQALREFARRLGFRLAGPPTGTLGDRRQRFDPEARHRRTVLDMEGYIQSLVRAAEHVRDRAFLFKVLPELTEVKWSTERVRPTWPPAKFIDGARAYRERFREDGIGVFDQPYLPLNPRTRKVAETGTWTAWDVVIDVWPDVFAWGVIVIPKGIAAGERRPVVVVQHGRNGLPRETIDRHVSYYNDFGSDLADRGFVVFAPHNLYRGEDRYRWLSRKANTIRATLFSFILGQHERILEWLGSLSFVDADRIAFYGLSYGGETALRIPAVLEKYALSICSGDFNQWTRKVAATDEPFSFMRTIEWEMPYWNWGRTFDYAEMAYLIFPRPFMVERGHLDLVGRDQWVAHEYGKVQFLYAQLGLADRTAIEYFQGGHSINKQGTFAFLHEHLRWPAPK
jgi:dienelactone hydrolase